MSLLAVSCLRTRGPPVRTLQWGVAQVGRLTLMGLLDDAIREHLDLKRARGADPAEIERLEREALGPLRRGPALGVAPFEDDQAVARQPFDHADYDDQYFTDLEELQELGYHDSTAPHLQHWHQHDQQFPPHGGHPSLGDGEEDRYVGDQEAGFEAEQPRRRFLRRTRVRQEADAAGPMGYDEAAHHHDSREDFGSAGAYRLPGSQEPGDEPDDSGLTPPHLRFEHPPKRPSFSAEPTWPLNEPPDDRPVPPATGNPESESSLPPHDSQLGSAYDAAQEMQGAGSDTQETTEFDVPGHLSEPQPTEPEDVLEETPDFLQDTPEHDRLWFEQRPPRDFDFNG